MSRGAWVLLFGLVILGALAYLARQAFREVFSGLLVEAAKVATTK